MEQWNNLPLKKNEFGLWFGGQRWTSVDLFMSIFSIAPNGKDFYLKMKYKSIWMFQCMTEDNQLLDSAHEA